MPEEKLTVKQQRDVAVGLLKELQRHTRLTDKNEMKFTTTYPEGTFDRMCAFLKRIEREEQ